LKYFVILICVDYILLLLSKKELKAKAILNIQPVKTFLTLASGISDSIGLENLLWRNQLNFWHLPVVFLSGIFMNKISLIKFSCVGSFDIYSSNLFFEEAQEGKMQKCMQKGPYFWNFINNRSFYLL